MLLVISGGDKNDEEVSDSEVKTVRRKKNKEIKFEREGEKPSLSQ